VSGGSSRVAGQAGLCNSVMHWWCLILRCLLAAQHAPGGLRCVIP
jgi:hypothetical protein